MEGSVYVPELALRRVAEGGWVIGVAPNTTVRGRLVMVLFPALTLRNPMAGFQFLPFDLGGAVGLRDLAVGGVHKRPARALLPETNMFALLSSGGE